MSVEVRRVAPGDDAMIKILAEHHAEAFGYRAAPARVAEMLEHAKASCGTPASEIILFSECSRTMMEVHTVLALWQSIAAFSQHCILFGELYSS